MTKCRNNFLLNDNFITYGATLTFGKTISRAGCRYCFVNKLGMTKCRNNFLLNDNFITYGAALAFGQSRFGTSGINRNNKLLGMYVGVDRCILGSGIFLGRSNIRRGSRINDIASGEHNRTYKQYQTSDQRNPNCFIHSSFTFTFQPVGIYTRIIASFVKKVNIFTFNRI